MFINLTAPAKTLKKKDKEEKPNIELYNWGQDIQNTFFTSYMPSYLQLNAGLCLNHSWWENNVTYNKQPWFKMEPTKTDIYSFVGLVVYQGQAFLYDLTTIKSLVQWLITHILSSVHNSNSHSRGGVLRSASPPIGYCQKLAHAWKFILYVTL